MNPKLREATLAAAVASAVQVAIDGPSGSGKSTVARRVAALLHGDYVDTGATYRAMAWWMLRCGVNVADPDEIAARVDGPIIEVGVDPQSPAVWVDAQDVTTQVREPDVSAAVSQVAAVPQVRSRLVALQQAYAHAAKADRRAIVMEGRDIASVVMPRAQVKVWLTADLAARAARRAAQERAELGLGTAEDGAAQDLKERDEIDATRAATPVAMSTDAAVIDATHLGIDEVVDEVLMLVAAALGVTGD